ncbi:glycosyltransferase family 22 protein [Chaetomium sp. MPI-SDFR-AT-0129]|nr:glycosyltransferase family 22 protein [Chaetomium sp. MPI-SDFR-AT-0129]
MAPPKNAQFGVKAASTPSRDGTNGGLGIWMLDTLLTLSIPALILVYLVVAPHTKVEESFNIQATHDILAYGTPTSDIYNRLSATYDHFDFPGAVPRTFVGAVLLAGFADPIVALVGFQHAQLVVRALLGLFNAGCLLYFARNLRRAYGPGPARWYLLLQASQFHVLFYASRTLPNMFAFGLTTLAFAFLVPRPANPGRTAPRQRMAITTLVFAAVIFRSEVALLLIATTLHQILVPCLDLQRVVFPFIVSFIIALAISVPIDSYFWQPASGLIWPELAAFHFNVVGGHATEWGIEPWWWYFKSALPRLLLNPVVFAGLLPYALWRPWQTPSVSRAASRLVTPSVLFVALFSFQPHKEARFVLYAVPPLTAAAALGANQLWRNAQLSFTGHDEKEKKKQPSGGITAALSPLAALVVILSILASFAASSAKLALSALNYPGGEALTHVRDIVQPSREATTTPYQHGDIVAVHADVLACMTGVTLFHTGSHPADLRLRLPTPETDNTTDQDKTTTIKIHNTNTNPTPSNDDAHPPAIYLDKTEDSTVLADPVFWSQFDYLLLHDPVSTLPSGQSQAAGVWDTVGVVQGYAGVEVLQPESTPASDSGEAGKGDGGDKDENSPPVVGLGKCVAEWKDWARKYTGGWWVGPRMVDQIYILRRVRGQQDSDGGDGSGKGIAVESS